MIYMDRSLNPLFVTLQGIDKSKGWKSSLDLVEIQHVDIVIFCNTSDTDYVTVTCNDIDRQFSEEGLSGVIKRNTYEALPGVLGNRGIMPFISGEQGNKSLKLKGTGEQRQFLGTRNKGYRDFDLGEQGKMPISQGNKGTGTPSGRALLRNLQ